MAMSPLSQATASDHRSVGQSSGSDATVGFAECAEHELYCRA